MFKNREASFFLLAALLLFVLSLCLHLFRLGSVPPGFYWDECAIGYNAWSLALTGKDEYGTAWPMFFRCFDNYHEPVMVYVLVPFVKIFGLSKELVRLPGVFFHMAAAVMFYFLAYEHVRRRWMALFSALIFSLLPWAFPLSRVTMSGFMPMLLGICCGWFFLLRAMRRRSYYDAVLAALGWAFAMYAHNCGRPTTALTLVIFVLAFNLLLWKRRYVFMCFCGSFVLFMVPMILAVLRTPAILSSRFDQIAVWKDNPAILVILRRVAQRYFEYFSPKFLFIHGDSNLRHHSAWGGELFLFMAPLVLLGIWVLLRHLRRNPIYRFLFFSLLAYPAATILTLDHMHATRSLNGAPYWCVLALLGARFAWQHGKLLRKMVLLLMLFSLIEISACFTWYFCTYPKVSRGWFDASFIESIEWAVSERKEGERIYLSSSAFNYAIKGPDFKPFYYAPLLFCGRVPPDLYQREGLPNEIWQPYYPGRPLLWRGLLIRTNPLIGTEKMVMNNSEPLPPGAELLYRIKTETPRTYEIYAVPAAVSPQNGGR